MSKIRFDSKSHKVARRAAIRAKHSARVAWQSDDKPRQPKAPRGAK